MVNSLSLALILVLFAVRIDYNQASPRAKLDGTYSGHPTVELDSCKDFYNFACHEWMEKESKPTGNGLKYSAYKKQIQIVEKKIREILKSKPKTDDPSAVNQARQFYSDCTNTGKLDRRGYAPLVQLADRLGGWPMLNNQPLLNTTVMEAILQFNNISIWRKDVGFFHNKGLFGVKEDRLPEINTNFTIYPPFILWDHPYLRPFSTPNPYTPYESYLHNVLFEIKTKMSIPYLYTDVIENINKVIKFETRLVRSLDVELFESVQRRQFIVKEFQSFYDNCPISESNQPSRIDWLAVLKAVNPAIEVNENTKITVMFPNFFQEMASVLHKVDVWTVRNFMVWTAVTGLLTETTSRMRDIHLQHYPIAAATREDICSRIVQEDKNGPILGLIYAVGSEYVKQFVSPEGKTLVSLVQENIREAYINLIHNNTWMDDFTKINLESKLRSFEIEVAYPDWILNKDLLKEYYEGLIIQKGKHFENYIALMNFQARRHLHVEKFSAPYNSHGLISVSAWYDREAKLIAIPAGGFSDPFYYHDDGLSAANFGAIGSVIGHEMSHLIFSYLGKVNRPGEIQVWSNESTETANDNSECYSKLYNQLALDANVTLRGKTLEEDVSDNLGFAAAYSAYRTWNEDEISKGQGVNGTTKDHQQFYLSFAQVWCANTKPDPADWINSHSPEYVRVNGPIMNSPHFGEDWDCPIKSPMNPEIKCYF